MSEDSLLLWGFGLIGGGIVVFLLELLIPSAGVLGIVSLAMALGGVVAFFNVSVAWGMISLLLVGVLIPIAAVFAFRIMPHTPIGKALFLQDEEADRQRAEIEKQAARSNAREIVGQVGTAITDLHPAGRIEVDGTRYDALAVTGLINRGQQVRVIDVWGTEVRVRALKKNSAG